MNVEDKLDEDFLFYLSFTGTAVEKLGDCDKAKAKQWLHKLCGEVCTTVAQKRNRNIFLSNLLLDIEEKQFTGPFLQNPDEINFDDAGTYFPAIATEVKTPPWVHQDLNETPPVEEENTNGRTYVATRTMPGGEGAFAYVAINMSDEPMMLGGGEGVFDNVMQQKFKEYVPPQTEMETILARRKDPNERQRVITFYDVILQNIADELDGKIKPEDNEQVDGLLNQLVQDLQSKGEYEKISCMCGGEQRIELLFKLFDLTARRKRLTQNREEILDQIGAELQSSFFETAEIAEENKFEMPAAMWEYCMNKPPSKKAIEALRQSYPAYLVETFLELLSNAKEEIAKRIHRRHTNIITQMKHELRVEGDKYKKWVDEIVKETDQMNLALEAIKAAYAKQLESKEQAEKRKKGGETELSGLYENMRNALLETQLGVEKESERGHFLVQQINDMNAQTETYSELSDQDIMNIEKANMDIMRNIKRLQGAVQMHEARLQQLTFMQSSDRPETSGQMFIM